MIMERTASLSIVDAACAAVAPARSKAAKPRNFAPIDECESTMFASLKAKEDLAAAADSARGAKRRLPRFSLLRGEVALLASQVMCIGR